MNLRISRAAVAALVFLSSSFAFVRSEATEELAVANGSLGQPGRAPVARVDAAADAGKVQPPGLRVKSASQVVSHRAKLTALDAAAGAQFGDSVAICGDTVVVGTSDTFTSGSAYVFPRNQGGADGWGQVARLTASDGEVRDHFGDSVAISGDTVVVGAHADNDAGDGSGSAYIFARNWGGGDNWGQVRKLTASDAAASDYFAESVAISGDTVVVGACGNDDAGSESGSVYIFERNQGGADNWGEVTKLTASDAAARDHFGCSVAISGWTVVVGAHRDDDAGGDSGSAYVFERGPAGWSEVAKLTASDAAAYDEFGWPVAVSDDTVVVGARFDDDGGSNSGSAYVFVRNLGADDNWSEVAKLAPSDAGAADTFGSSVAISGDTVIVGAPLDDEVGDNSGSAYVFERNQGGDDTWGQVQKLAAFDANADDQFGGSVAISGNTFVVGARYDDDSGSASGSAYLFAPHRARAWTEIAKPTASDAADSTLFGYSVAVNGDTLVVGALYDDAACPSDPWCNSGSAWVFERNAPVPLTLIPFPIYPLDCPDCWGRVKRLTASDATKGDLFGASVAISGDTVVVGASSDDDACPSDPGCDSGSVYVFVRNHGGADNWGQVAKLTALDAAAGGLFGASVAISGDTLVVGAPGHDDVGAAYIWALYRTDPGWAQLIKLTASDGAADHGFGGSVAISGDTAIVGASGDDDHGVSSGAAYVFERNRGGADGWGQATKLTASDGAYADFFGDSVVISADTVVIGAQGDDDAGSWSGAAYVFARNWGGAGSWGQVQKLTASDGAEVDFFGDSVAISQGTVIVGADGDNDLGASSGAAYVFSRNQGGADGWGQVQKLIASDGVDGDNFGASVSISGSTLAVGAPFDDDAGLDSGAAYVFRETDLIFQDGFESGDTSTWSTAVP